MPPHRLKLDAILQSHLFAVVLGGVLTFNIVLLVLQTDAQAKGDEPSAWMSYAEYALTIIYILEIGLKIYVRRWRFVCSSIDLFDLIIVGIDVLFIFITLEFSNDSDSLPSPMILRLFRVARLGRIVSLLHIFPELWTLTAGLAGALKVMFWGMLLINVWLIVLSIVAVQFIHPINLEIAEEGMYDGCERCPRAFSSVASSMLTFTQTLLAGDSWGQLAVPIVERAPLTYAYFLLVLTTTCIAAVNLILAAIVEAAQQARMKGEHELVAMREAELAELSKNLHAMCQQLDTDQTGSLSLDELRQGFQDNSHFRNTLKAMDVSDDELGTVFAILDQDRSGDVDYSEFATEVAKMKTNDSHMMLVFIKHYTKQMHDELLSEVRTHIKEAVDRLKDLEISRVESESGPIAGNRMPSPPSAAQSAALAGRTRPLSLPPETARTQHDVYQAKTSTCACQGKTSSWPQLDAKFAKLEAIFELAHNDARRLIATRMDL